MCIFYPLQNFEKINLIDRWIEKHMDKLSHIYDIVLNDTIHDLKTSQYY